MANPKHVFDFEGILNMKADQKNWKEVKQKLEDSFGELKIGIEEGIAESEAKKYVEVINKVLTKAKLPNIGVDDLLNGFDKVTESITRAIGLINNIDTSALKGIETSLEHIAGQVDKIVGAVDAGLQKVEKGAAKSVQALDKELAKLGDSYSEIQKTLNYESKGSVDKRLETLRDLYKDLNEILKDNDASWSDKQQAGLKFIKAYESYYSKASKSGKEAIPAHLREAYNKYLPKSRDWERDLQNLINRREGKALVGVESEPWAREDTLQKIQGILEKGITVNNNDDNQNNKSSPSKHGRPKQQDENAIRVYRGIIPPEDDDSFLTRKELIERGGGGEWWTSKKNVAQTYADQANEGAILVGTISPKNPLIIDAGKNQFDAFDKMPGLQTEYFQQHFADILEEIKNGTLKNADDIQAAINARAKELGHDVVEFQNVYDTMNPHTTKELSSAFSILDDSVIKVNQSFKQLRYDEKESIGEYTIASKEIPKYYKIPEAMASAEASAEVNRKVAQEAEKERLAQEASAKAAKEKADATAKMVDSLKAAKANIGNSSIEHMSLVGANGEISTVDGDEAQVPVDTLVGQLIDNLKNNILMSLHNHPDGLLGFTPGDLKSYAGLYKGQGIDVHGIIYDEAIKVIDLKGASKEVIIQVMRSFSERLNELATQSNGLVSFENEELILLDTALSLQNVNPETFEQVKKALEAGINNALNAALADNGIKFTVKSFTVNEDLPKLADYLLQIQQNSQNAISPVEKLAQLIPLLNSTKGLDDINDASELETKLAKRKEIFDLLQREGLLTDDIKNKYGAVNKEIEEKIALLQKAQLIDVDEDAELIEQENGSLEEKLERLQQLSDEWGQKISQKKRDRYEELNQKDMDEGLTTAEENRMSDLYDEISTADEALEEFDQTYDKIILKLANGKKVEIFPDDKGLSSLYKVSEEYNESYNGVEIEDVVFERKKKEVAENKKLAITYDELKEKVETYYKVVNKFNNMVGSVPVDDPELFNIATDLREKKEDIASNFPLYRDERGFEEDYTRDDISHMLTDTLDKESVLQHMCKVLGIEIPQAAEKAEIAIKDVTSAQEQLNAEEEKRRAINALELYARDPEIWTDKIQEITQKYPNLLDELIPQRDEIKAKLQPIDEISARISKGASIKDILPDDLKQEAANVGKRLTTMYDEGIRDTEEYVTLQYKLLNILEKLSERFGGMRSSGAKSKSELRAMIGDSIFQETGFNPMMSDASEALWGQDTFSIMKSDNQSFKMREMAARLQGSDDFWTERDYDKLSELNKAIGLLTKVRQEASLAKQSVDALNDSLEKEQKVDETLGAETKNVSTTPTDSDAKVSIDTEALKNVLSAITYNVKVVQDADAPDGEKTSLIDTEALKGILTQIVYNVKIANDDADKNANKITLDDSTLEQTLNRVFANILNPVTQQNDGNSQEPYALEKTLQSVKSVLDIIKEHTSKIGAIEIKQPTTTTVGDVLATETTLSAIKKAVEAINSKVVKGTKAKTSGDTSKKNAESYDGSQYFPEKLKTQTMYLAKFRAQLMTTGKLTDEVDAQIYELLDGLAQIKNGPDFSKWNQQFLQLKTSVGITDIFDKASNKEVITSYQELVSFQKMRNKLELQYEKAKDGSAIKQFYKEQLAQMDTVISKQAILNKNDEQEAKLAEIRKQHERELGELQAQKADASNTETQKKEAEVVKNIIKLYKQYGVLKERAGAVQGEELTAQISQEVDAKLREIQEAEKLLNNITPELRKEFDGAFVRGQGEEADRQLEALAKSMDAEKNKSIKDLGKVYEELGVAQAKFAQIGSHEAENEVNVLESIIASEKERLNLTAQQIADMETRRNLAKEEAKLALEAKDRDKITRHYDKEAQKALRKEIAQNKKDAGLNIASSALNSGRKAMGSLWQVEGVDTTKIASVINLNEALKNLSQTQFRISQQEGPVSPEDELLLKNQTTEVAKYTQQVKELIANYERFSGDSTKEIGSFVGGGDIETQLRNAVTAATNGKAQIKSYNAETQELTYAVKTGAHTFTEYTAGVRQADKALVSVQGTTKQTEKFFDSFKRKLSEIFRYFSASSLIYKAFNELRKGIQYIREIDSALTELKKVTDETEETYDKFLNTAAKTADKVGSTIQEIVSSTADWARIGYSLKDAATLAETTAVLLNVSEFQSIEDATSALTSTLQAFSYTAEQSMDVVDVLNEVGNNFAISSDGIATALKDSASSLVAANNSYQESVALIAAANKVVQDPGSVGAALRTISLRLRGTSTKELEEAGEDTTGVVESKSKLRTKIQGYTGIDILTDSGAYKSTYEILLEISKVWDDLTDQDRAGLLELIAGKTRSNTAAAILSNTEDLEEAFKAAQEAEGSALRENEKYLDSIQGRIDLFNNSVQTMWENALNSDAVKRIVDFGTMLVKIIDDLGLIQTLFIGIGTYLMTKYDLTGAIGGFFDSKTLNKAAERLDLEDQLKEAKEELDNIWAQGTDSDSDFSPELEAASQKVDDLNKKIKQNGMSINDANAKMKQFGDVTNETGRKGIKAWDKLKGSAKKFGKQLLNTLKSMAIMYAITTALSLISDLLGGLKDFIDGQIETVEEAQEKFEELNSELSSVKSELNNLNSELEDTQKRIDELLAQGSLSFTEQEELKRLRAENAELERKIALNETLEESLQKSTNAASIHATDMYLDTSFGSELSKTERQEEAAETGGKWGKYGGAAVGAIIGAFLGPAGALIGGLIGAGIGAFIGEPIGEAIGSAVEGAAYDAEQTVENAMNNMVSQRAELKKNQDEALANKDSEAYKEATEALQMYDKQMAEHINQIQANYNATDWELASPEERKKMMAYADWLDKFSIDMGTTNAKSNAIARIFGEEADVKLKNIKSEIEAAMNAAKVDETDPNFDFQTVFNADGMEEFRQRLYDMGLTITDIEYYFLDLAKAEKEAEDSYSTFDTVKQINSLSGEINSLKDAFGEITEEGYVSTETLVELEETFGGLGDSWKNFVDIVATGTGSIKEATEAINELVEAYLIEQLANGPMTAEEELKTIMFLQQLGVKNAKEYINAMQKASMAETIAKNIVKDDEKELELKTKIDAGEATEDEIKKYNELVNKSQEDYIKEIEGLYEVDLTPEEERLLIEKAITAEKAKQDAITKREQKNTYDTAVREKKIAEDTNKYYDDRIQNVKNGDFGDITITTTSEFLGPGAGYKHYYNYNGKKYSSLEAVKEAIIADLEAQKVEVPELPIEVTEAKVINAEAVAESTEADLNTTFDNLGLEVDIVLADPSDLVDDIQNVFDTLQDAVNEYNENGYLSIDTAQALTDPKNIDPKYLTLLKDENGELKLTKEKLYEVAIARLTDLKVKRQDAILTDAENLAKTGSIEKLRESSEVLYGEADALQTVNKERLKTIRGILEERQAKGELVGFNIDNYMTNLESQIDATGKIFDSAIENIRNSFSTSGNTETAEIEDAFQKAMDYWDNRIEANQAKYDQIQNDIDWLESQGKMADANYYKDQIALITEGEESKTALLNNKFAQAAARMRELEAAGQEGSDEWWEAAKIYNDTLSELDDVRDTVIELQDAIGEVEWSQFEEFNTRLDDINSKLETMRDLIAPNGEEDWFDDEGNFTEKGVAVLGSYVQSLEYYKNGLAETNKELEEFQSKEYNEANAEWFANTYGIHSEQEYYDYLKKLTDEQYNYATAVSDTEQDIASMYESSIDAVEEYTSELIESYNDYIDVVKEALDAERDLYNFKKDVKKQTKDIANLERRIASLSGSTNASDIAERRRLEAELYDSRESLNDTYYEHSMDSQQEALDQEAEAYEEAMNKFIENLRTNLDLALEDMDSFLTGVTAAVTTNAPTILSIYKSLGVAVDDALLSPWQEITNAMNGFATEGGLAIMNSWAEDGGVFDTFASNASDYLKSIWTDTNIDPSDAFENAIVDKIQRIKAVIKENVETIEGYWDDVNNVADTSVDAPPPPSNNSSTVTFSAPAGSANVRALQEVLNTVFNAGLTVDGVLGNNTTNALKKAQTKMNITADGKYGPKTRNAIIDYIDRQINLWRSSSGSSSAVGQGIQAYLGAKKILPTQLATGTVGLTSDQWAITDESWIGEEITLAAGKNGQLQYLKKGSAVMPADISANLVEWGKLNPKMMNVGGGANINMISNAVMKPSFELNFDSMVHVDHCDEGTLKDLEKMVDNKINKLTKDMNYALKRVGGR